MLKPLLLNLIKRFNHMRKYKPKKNDKIQFNIIK
jgi:hypothetical protein